MKLLIVLSVILFAGLAQATVYNCVDTSIQGATLSARFDTEKQTGSLTIPRGGTTVTSRTVKCSPPKPVAGKIAPLLTCNVNTTTDSGYEFSLNLKRGYIAAVITPWSMIGPGPKTTITCTEQL